MNENYSNVTVKKETRILLEEIADAEDRSMGNMVKIMCDYWVNGHKKV